MKSDFTREIFTADSEARKDLDAIKEHLRSSKSYAVRQALQEFRKIIEQKEAS